jgi:hypothetical protein
MAAAVLDPTVRFAAAPAAAPARPLSTAPYQLVQGEQGALVRAGAGVALRSLLIGGGMYAAGVRSPAQLAVGAVAASLSLSLLQVAMHHVAQRSR